MSQLSVVICSHNPRPDFLRRTLDSLQAQSLPKTQWKLLLIDNASREPLAQSWDLSWHPQGMHIREEELGLTPARLRGIREAYGDLLVFVDDDNVLAADFLERAAEIAKSHPHLGVFGAGVLQPEYEMPPASQVTPFLFHLALREVSRALWSNNPRDYSCIPWGAGLCVTPSVASYCGQLVHRLNINDSLDRLGEELCCGGDDLFSWAAVDAGQSFGIFPALRIAHLIAASRVQPAYLVRLIQAHAYSHAILRFLMFAEKQPATNLIDVAKDFAHGLRRGRFSFRCRRAAARGARAARHHIAEKGLRPLADSGLGVWDAPALPSDEVSGRSKTLSFSSEIRE